MIPRKLRILKALTDTLKTITPANGYQSDLADFDPGDGAFTPRVYRGRAFFGDEDPVPMISILEAVEASEDVVAAHKFKAVSEYFWPLLVQGFVKDDKTHPTDPAYTLLADVRQCLAREASRRSAGSPFILGFPDTKVTGMQIGSGIVRPANELSAYAGFHLTLGIGLIDDAEEPYG